MSNRQVAMADVILVNKIDLVSEEDKTKVLSLIRYVSLNDLHHRIIFISSDRLISLLRSTKQPVHGIISFLFSKS